MRKLESGRAYLDSELSKLARVLVLDQEGGSAQLVNVHLQGLVRNVVLRDLCGVLVDLVCQLLRCRAAVLTVVPVTVLST